MAELHDLRDLADRGLAGLKADPNLKARIVWKSQQMNQPDISCRSHGRTIVFACACLMVFALLGFQKSLYPRDPSAVSLVSHSAGSGAVQTRALLGLNQSQVSIGISSAGTSGNFGLWSRWSDGAYPLVGIRGKFYRQLNQGASQGTLSLGSVLGEVDTYTTDPSLTSTDLVVSNVLPVGTDIYAVSGMGSTLCAVKTDDGIALFQRVSYSGHATLGREQLKDTLQVAGHVVRMELTGVGTVSDANVCESLLETLFATATHESNGSLHADRFLIMTLDNGVRLQLSCSNEKLAACGIWSSPEFLDAFQNAAS